MGDLISRQAAIKSITGHKGVVDKSVAKRILIQLPTAQPEQAVQEILNYLDTELHPLVSPEHWNVYSELHDMVSTLSSAQPEHSEGLYVDGYNDGYRDGMKDAQPNIEEDEDIPMEYFENGGI